MKYLANYSWLAFYILILSSTFGLVPIGRGTSVAISIVVAFLLGFFASALMREEKDVQVQKH